MRFRPLAGCGLFPIVITSTNSKAVSVPLRGVGCFLLYVDYIAGGESFRPLAGCGLFPYSVQLCEKEQVSVPLRGVGCFSTVLHGINLAPVSVPLRGVGCFGFCCSCHGIRLVSVPLRGVGCFGKAAHSFWCNRKKNCQLCCFIVSYWQMFINSKLRNCKVPCEAHKTAT